MDLSLPRSSTVGNKENALFYRASKWTVMRSRVQYQRKFFILSFAAKAGHEVCGILGSTEGLRLATGLAPGPAFLSKASSKRQPKSTISKMR